jgi:hypothetical protein
MFTITQSEVLRCSPKLAFEFAGDYTNDPKWRSGVLSMDYETGGPPSVGTRTRERMRSMGVSATTVSEVTEYSPARTAFQSLSGPVDCSGSRDFAACPSGTMFIYSLTLQPRGVLRIAEPILRMLLTRQVLVDMKRLKWQIECMEQPVDAACATNLQDPIKGSQ